MCGIAGILGRDDRALGARMAQAIAHRGPDGHDVFTGQAHVAFARPSEARGASAPGSGFNEVTLAHRRLAIIDLATGQQPMTDTAGRYTIVYNGEIYNHAALRLELEQAGSRFATHSDTEVILEGWAAWGPRVLERLEGIFAFALWDAQTGELVLARDPWGVKPLFFAWHDGAWYFGSEMKALKAAQVPFAADNEAFKELAVLEYLSATRTLVQGIRQVPPRAFVSFQGAATHVHGYALGATAKPASLEDAVRLAKDGLVRSVREQLMAEVPLGTILSGGLDSSLVAWLHHQAAREGGHPIQTFTLAESEDVEDFRQAAELARVMGTQHHASFFTADEVWGLLPRHAWHNESTNYTEAFFFPLFARMRRHVTVGLCGQGSDELWGGYQRYKDPAALAATRLARIERIRPAGAKAMVHAIHETHATGQALARSDQQGQLSNFQLRLVDRNSMAHGLEVRVPFLSRPLQALSDATPWEWKLRPAPGTGPAIEKWVVRQAAAELGLPKPLAWRPKVPAGRATGPGLMEAIEARAARTVEAKTLAKHPLAACFERPAEYLMHRAWEELFLHDVSVAKLRLEDLR